MFELSSALYQRLMRQIVRAGFDPMAWGKVLETLHETFGGMKAQLIGFDAQCSESLPEISVGYSDSETRSYAEHFQYLNPWAARFGEMKEQQIFNTDSLISRESLVRTEFYGDWLHPQGDLTAGGGALLFKTPSRLIMIGGNMPETSRDRFQSAWEHLLADIMPLLRDALECNRLLNGARLDGMVRDLVGASQGTAVAVIGSRFSTLHLNDAACRIVDGAEGLIRLTNGRIESAQREVARLLEDCRSALTWGRPVRGQQHAVAWQGGQHIAQIMPLDSFGAHLSIPSSFRTERPAALLVIRQMQARCSLKDAVKARFAMTDSVAAVACGIAQGLSIAEISQQRQTAEVTVRNQVKAALAATETRRQSELVRVILSLEAEDRHSRNG